jgi:hypothetical protein
MNTWINAAARGALVCLIALAALVSIGQPSPAAAGAGTPFTQREHPIYLIASYYNAIVRQDYARAYNYWAGNAPGGATYQQFVQGFADLQNVRVLARLPIIESGAAGTTYADVPVVVLTTLKSGGSQIFTGCFTTRRDNISAGNPLPNWSLHSARLQLAASADFLQAANTCTTVRSFPTGLSLNSQSSPVGTITSYYDAIAAGDYTRAYNYWTSGPPNQTLAQFAQGFAGTANIGVVVALDFQIGGAAGSTYVGTPVLITATSYGTPQLYAGCIVARQSNVPIGNPPIYDLNWYLYSANLRPVASCEVGLRQVWSVCTL